MRILLVSDDLQSGSSLKNLIEQTRHAVDLIPPDCDAADYIGTGNYDEIVLDITKPDSCYIAPLAALREQGLSTPLLLLTVSQKLEDRVAALEAGADDCLARPFAATELVARVKALLRRSGNYTPVMLAMGNLSLCISSYRLMTPGNAVRLNNKEFQLMELFMRNPRNLFSSEQLMDRVWGWDTRAEINVVWTNIASLRKKLSQVHANVAIRSIRNVGYLLEEA